MAEGLGTTENAHVDEQQPQTWAEAILWLRGASAGSADTSWRNELIEEATPADRDNRLNQVAELAIERLTRWTIGQIFPGLPQDLALSDLNLTNRARNALTHKRVSSTGELTNVTINGMMDWQNVGIGTVAAILRSLAEASISRPASRVELTTHDDTSHPSPLGGQDAPTSSSPIIADLSVIAAWQVAIGLPNASLVEGPLPPSTPDVVTQARHRLSELNAHDVLDDAELEGNAAGLLDRAINTLDVRAIQVLKKRFFADQPSTLEELGEKLGVTRERARQIEGKARAAMLDALTDQRLRMLADTARGLIGTVRPLSDLLFVVPALARTVGSVEQPAWRVFDRLDDAYEIENGWCAVPTLGAARDSTWTHLQERADAYGVARVDDIDMVETSEPERHDELTRAWLETCGYVVYDDHVLTRTRSVGDYAAAILSIEGSPMSAEEIVERFAFERSSRSLKNAMGKDDRFDRVDRDSWALGEWGLDTYGGIRSVIRGQLTRAGGEVHIDHLLKYITSNYNVSERSVISYASLPPFKTRNNVVRHRVSRAAARKKPEETVRLFRREDGWAYRVKITHDHLRGSGSPAPMAITTIFDMEFGDRIELDSDLGPQAIQWAATQPTFGTIRRFLLNYDVAADTQVFLVMRDDNTFAVQAMDELTGDPLADALTLIGAPRGLSGLAARRVLTRAVRLPEDVSTATLISAYRDRGDDDLAVLLASVRPYL